MAGYSVNLRDIWGKAAFYGRYRLDGFPNERRQGVYAMLDHTVGVNTSDMVQVATL